MGYAGAERGRIRIFGGTWSVQFEHVDLTLSVDQTLCWPARVAFAVAPELEMPFQGVLGTEGFLDKFAVTSRRMARMARMPLADEVLAVLGSALRDPNVVPRYQAKIVTVPGSECLWWSGTVSGQGHGRFYSPGTTLASA